MKLLLLSVIGIVATSTAAELGLDGLRPSELKEIQKEIAAGNVPPNFTAEKPKRGVAKLTNTDNANFNYLSNPKAYTSPQATFSAQPSYAAPQQTVSYTAPQQAYTSAQQPLRVLYGNQYFPANQYLSYLQNPQVASQIAAQYSYPQAVPHYVQTPTQIQYVSPPNYQGVPSAQFKALTSKTPVVSSTASAQTASQATSQVVLPSNMAASPVQYQQPQIVMYLISPQHQQALLAQQQSLLYPGHQMVLLNGGNPLLGLYNSPHRFGLQYNPSAAGQLSYVTGAEQQQQYQTLQPQQQQYQTLQPQQQYQTLEPATQQTSSSDNSAQKQQAINVQESASSNAFGVRTKA